MKVEGWLALATIAGTVATIPALVRRVPEVRPWALGSTGVLALALTVWAVAGPGAVPDEALVVVREGPEREVLDAVVGRHPWLPAGVAVDVAPIRVTTWVQLAVGAVALALWVPLARALGGPVGAFALTVAACASPWTVHAVLAPGPGATLLLCTMAGAVAVAARRHPRPWVRGTAAATTFAAAALAATARPESLLIGAPIALWTASSAAWPGVDERAGAALRRVHPGIGVLLLWALTSAGLYALDAVLAAAPSTAVQVTGGSVRDTLVGSARLPMDLLGFFPVALAAATLVGLVHALRASVAWALLAVGAFLLARTYALAGHLGSAPYETLRYGTGLLGPLLLLALLGASWVGRVASPRMRTAWWGLVLLTAALPRARSPHELAGPPWRLAVTTQTVEARFVARILEREPECLVAVRLLDPGAAPSEQPLVLPEEEGEVTSRAVRGGVSGMAYFGGPQGPLTPPGGAPERAGLAEAGFDATARTAEELEEAARRAGLPCVVVLEGLDCEVPLHDCSDLFGGRRPDVTVTEDVPEINTHHERHDGPVTLRALVLRP